MIGYKKYLHIDEGDILNHNGNLLVVVDSEAIGDGKCSFTVRGSNGQHFLFETSKETMLPVEIFLMPTPKPKS